MNSKSFIHHAMKQWDCNDAHDSIEKNRLQKILKKHFNYYCLFDRTIFISKYNYTWTDIQPNYNKKEIYKKYHIHKPDILIKIPFNIIIELDGDFHFNTKKGITQTKLRNKIYNSMNVKFISFSTKQFNKMSDIELISKIKSYLEKN